MFFNDTATTEIYTNLHTLSLHDALPISMAAGMAVATFVAMLIIALSPIQDVTAELRARTQPTLLDLGVAVVGGVAGVYAIMRKLSGVMVGDRKSTRLNSSH